MARVRRIPFSADELAFVQAHAHLRRAPLHAAFVAAFGRTDVTVDHVKALCSRHGWTRKKDWSGHEDALLRARYPDTPTATLATELGRTIPSVYQRARVLGLEKSEAYLASPAACRLRRGDQVGKATRFRKGQAPANKGVTRGRGWAPGRMREGQFKRGQRGHNWKPIGATRVIDGYEYTKVADVPNVPYTVNWKATQLLRWSAVHGPVPEGHVLKCLDGNRLNTDPANWRAIPRALLPLLNGKVGRRLAYDDAPAELKPTLLTLAQLEQAAAQRRQPNRRGEVAA